MISSNNLGFRCFFYFFANSSYKKIYTKVGDFLWTYSYLGEYMLGPGEFSFASTSLLDFPIAPPKTLEFLKAYLTS